MISFIKKIIIKIIYILILIYLLIFVPCLWGKKPLIIISGSMEPLLKVGGIVYYEKVDNFNIGDILVYKIDNNIISHRIVEIEDNYFITKGDANENVDNHKVFYNEILGKADNYSLPYIGYYANFIYNHKYLLVILIALLIMEYFYEKNR